MMLHPLAMSTTVSTPKLSEVAKHLVIPDGITTSLFPRIEQRLSDADVFFDRWQRGVGQVALGCREDGKLAATVGGVVLSWPRQIGKTYSTGNLNIGDCLEFPGTRVAWTSHHNRTTTNTFRTMQAMVRRKKIWPHIAAIRTANGEQEIQFVNGSIIMFGAREQGFGRGMDKLDRLIFDEAQILSLKALEDMVPATNQAQHPHGGLVYFMGTPPRPSDDGEAFTAKRERALSGKSTDQVYIELSADEDADPFDSSIYPTFNPSFPHRTPLEAMQRMLENIPDEESIRREMMGIWPPPQASGAAITPELWGPGDPDATADGRVAFGVYVNIPRTHSAIGAATECGDGSYLVEVVPAVHGRDGDDLPGTAWIPGRVAELSKAHDPQATIVDSYSSAASLLPAFAELGVDVTTTNTVDMARACGLFYDLLVEGRIKHLGAPGLTKAALAAKWRELADARAWDRKDKTSDITQLVAVTLALYGLINAEAPKISAYDDHDLLIV